MCTTVGCSQGAGPHDGHDNLLLVGDWDGTARTPRRQLADLRDQLKNAYLDAVRDRDRASKDTSAEGRARAVAHQTHASRLLRILDSQHHGCSDVTCTEAHP